MCFTISRPAFVIAMLVVGLGAVASARAGATSTGATAAAQPSPIPFTVELADGSQLNATAQFETLGLNSPTTGETDVPVDRIRRVAIAQDPPSATVVLVDGSVLTGALAADTLPMHTLLGHIAIPVKVIVSLQALGLEDFATGLVADYTFDGNARDRSGNQLDGVVHGATPCEDKQGRMDSAYEFDGVDDYIKFGQDLLDMQEMTISAWVYAENGVPFLSDGDWAEGNDITLTVGPRSLSIRADKSGFSLNDELQLDVEMLHQWRHIAWTMTSEQSDLYIDGAHKARLAKGGSNVGYHNLMLGTMEFPEGQFGWMGYWKGKISSLKIYPRALTSDEIKKLSELDE